ncbi:restriction endonuclease subunit S [Shewanella bicestrii]|uniref:Restriction endonuclease subunit S n=2 Tax=Shewanella bicestrii TaxID=2018305 RepID=A0A220UT07_9GAMM|nr:restriction endonuclease subunit S [Shewanella bicestrii]
MPKYEDYVDSGVEWLGKLPNHWDAIKMKFLFKDTSVKNKPNETLLSVTQNQGVVPREWVENRMVMPSGNLDSFKFIEKGDFAISLRSFEGGLEYCHHDGIISPAYTVLKAKRAHLLAGYYKYLFKSQIFISELQTSIVGIREGKNISYEALQYSLLPIPAEEEQSLIANFLDKKTAQIDDAIAIKEQQISLLKERKQIIIQQAVTQGLDPNVPMKDSGVDWIGKIPEHWEVKQSRFLFRVVRRSDRRGDEVKYSVTQARGLVPTDEMIENSTQAESFDSFQLCHKGDLVLNKYKAHLGVFWKAPDRGIITNNYTVFSPLSNVSSKYFELLFHTPVYVSIFRTLVYGVTEGMSPLYTNDFYNMRSIVPPFDEQLQIESYVADVENRYSEAFSSLQNQISSFKEYKTTLINSAVTGKIKITPEMVEQ